MGTGVFRPDVNDPELSNADTSTVWELALLGTEHFHPAVRSVAHHAAEGAPSKVSGSSMMRMWVVYVYVSFNSFTKVKLNIPQEMASCKMDIFYWWVSDCYSSCCLDSSPECYWKWYFSLAIYFTVQSSLLFAKEIIVQFHSPKYTFILSYILHCRHNVLDCWKKHIALKSNSFTKGRYIILEHYTKWTNQVPQ